MTRLVLAAAFVAVLAAPTQAQDPSAEPTYGNARLEEGFLPDPHVTELTAGGSIEMNMGECTYGFVANAPDVDLYYTTSGGSPLYIYVAAEEDTRLLINLPNGNWLCNDDGFTGRNPLIVVPEAPAGLYDIWVGTYSDGLTPANLYISEVDPR